MITRSWTSPRGEWFEADWTVCVLRDHPDAPCTKPPARGRKVRRWTAAALRSVAWVAPSGHVYVLQCPDEELADMIRDSVGRRMEQWRREWKRG